MKTYLDCYPCFLRQALTAARMAEADEEQQWTVLARVLEALQHIEPTSTPPVMGNQIHRIVRQVVESGDPYRAAKVANCRQALALYPRMKSLLAEADNSLETAVRLSIAGNIIDLGMEQEYDLWETVERVLVQPFAIDDTAAFREALSRTSQVLYLADNAGETVFDRVLIELLDVPVVYAVKAGPILNDATRDDALATGIDAIAKIVSTGSDAPGTILRLCSEEFRQMYADADFVIAKGQANYETLSEAGPKVFFLLQIKCPVIARDAGVPMGSIVLKRG
ncbi:MAG: ARMT1-like domain-containing protein [Chloroflexota bacterium]|nr:ARMT1-like domain-containing protein [Chloroflexota bacterium]